MTLRRLLRYRRYWPMAAGILCLALLAWAVTQTLERLVSPPSAAQSQAAPAALPPGTPHITATLFYASPDSQSLSPVRRDVPLAEGVVAQGRQILMSQLQAAPTPHLSVIPDGTVLRAFYVTDRGDGFVDLSAEVSTGHPGGSATELLTVYAVVNAVTANLPSIQRVQILIDGKEAETLAGHIDLRRPLERNLTLVAANGGQ